LQLGISAPQGCGKTTIVTELEKLFAENQISCASVSIDDFYLSHASQQKISAAHPENRLLKGRGNAGTHDLQLGSETLSQLRKLGYDCAFNVSFLLASTTCCAELSLCCFELGVGQGFLAGLRAAFDLFSLCWCLCCLAISLVCLFDNIFAPNIHSHSDFQRVLSPHI
jgi:hypothetical protein